MKLNYKRTILLGFAFFLISAFWQAYDAIIPLIMTNHFGLLQSVSGAVMSLDNILAVFMLPVFGALSDKVCTKYGKRTPFIFIGTVAAVVMFVVLALIDGMQVNPVIEVGIPELYAEAAELRDAANELLKEGRLAGNDAMVAAAEAQLEVSDGMFEAVRKATYEITKDNIWRLIGFIGVLLLVLISMATFRSPAVALMPDVTVKPLRSKGNRLGSWHGFCYIKDIYAVYRIRYCSNCGNDCWFNGIFTECQRA